MHGFYCSHLPEFMLSGFHQQTAWHSEAVAFTPSPPIPIFHGGAAEAMGVGLSGEALGLGSGLFRADMLSTIFIYLTFHKKNFTWKKALLLTVRKRITVLKDFCGSLLPVTRKWGKLNSLPRHHPGTGFVCRPTLSFYLHTSPRTSESPTSYGASPQAGQGANGGCVGTGGPVVFSLTQLPYCLILPLCSRSLLRQELSSPPEPTASAKSSLCDLTRGPKGLLACVWSSRLTASTQRPLIWASSCLLGSIVAHLFAKRGTF